MKTGIELIAEERQEQIEKHGWNSAHDDIHDCGELGAVATCLLIDDYSLFPENWDDHYKEKFQRKNGIEALKVAGALIAAEIDRIQRLTL